MWQKWQPRNNYVYMCLCCACLCMCVRVYACPESCSTFVGQVEAGQRVGHAYAFNELYLFSYPAKKRVLKWGIKDLIMQHCIRRTYILFTLRVKKGNLIFSGFQFQNLKPQRNASVDLENEMTWYKHIHIYIQFMHYHTLSICQSVLLLFNSLLFKLLSIFAAIE